jgi:hypothetical protein
MVPEIIIAAMAGGALVKALEPLQDFAKTSQPMGNRYTVAAALHVLAHYRHWLRARDLIGARITSAYRSPEINQAVGGVANSDHVQGLACDFVPPTSQLWAAAKKMHDAVQSGALGPVRQFIVETYKSVLHLGYYPPGKSGPTEYLEQYAAGQHRKLSFEGKQT